MAVPNIFANVTTSIPLSQLDTNFATAITLGNTAVYLGNTTTTLGNLTLTNVTLASGTNNIASTPTTSIVNGTSNVSIASSGGSIVAATANTTAMTIDTSQNVGIGTGSPSSKLHVAGASGNGLTISGSGATGVFRPSSAGVELGSSSGDNTVFLSGSATERMRITSGGNLLLGTTTNVALLTEIQTTTEGNSMHYVSGSGGGDYSLNAMNSGGQNGAAAGIKMGKNSSTSRSINAGGTINASGADYAEYMVKAGSFTVAKGDVVGINTQGKLTNVFADAIAFVVKSTDPSYVGGDVWGSEQALGLTYPKYLADDATEEEKSKYASDKSAFETALEVARQTVDRIAFSGQVPVNVTGATAGQYIIPINDNGAIKGEAISNPTFEQYQIAVGKVIAIQSDGRAKIIVKVA